ncbi:PREDICTED: interferon-induced protein with tetratricopeptide repeats 1-like [Nanorana parkeri]|uniref:interferon-induced protein with tetratricopeptide repeats 1-like n=1 Tax=Nanorana parkeri TaxID=125878 RepID=UPI000854A242|nr:PREDICTED: interferon-induced protein with tetratricopeptide repeats 1-like [Nanorana parkeri]
MPFYLEPVWRRWNDEMNIINEKDIDYVEERLNYQVVFLPDAYNHRKYNILAYLKHLKGDHDEALLQLQKAESGIPASSTSEDTDVKRVVMYGNFAWVYYHQNQVDKGFTYAEKVQTILQKYESPAMQKTLLLDIYGEQGWTYMSFTGNYYQRAAECFEKALELDPEDPELNSGYALAVYRMEGFAFLSKPSYKSVPLLERAVQFNPSDTVVKVLLALKYLDLKNYRQATMLIEQALLEQPENPYVLRYVAMFYKRSGNTVKAIEVFKKVDSLTPNTCAIHYQLAKCYKIFIYKHRGLDGQPNGEAISNAMFHSKKAVELNKSSVAAHILLADIYIRANKYQKAEEEFDKTLTMSNLLYEQKQELHLRWAQYLMSSRKSESEAVNHFKEVIEIQNQTIFRESAIRALKSLAETMISQNPKDATGYGLLGFIHQQERRDVTALKNYEKAHLLDPDSEEYSDACAALYATLS